MGEVSKGEGRTVLFVSHDMNSVLQLCNKGLLISKGQVDFNGSAKEAVSKYLNSKAISNVYLNGSVGNKPMAIKKIQIVDEAGVSRYESNYSESVSIAFEIDIKEKIKDAGLFVLILNENKRRVFACELEEVYESMLLKIDSNQLVRGDYSIHAFINIPKIGSIDNAEDVCNFKILDSGSNFAKHGTYDYGNVFGRYSWEVNKSKYNNVKVVR
jgi:lipopolysaccharide transport system ATP-binding protein